MLDEHYLDLMKTLPAAMFRELVEKRIDAERAKWETVLRQLEGVTSRSVNGHGGTVAAPAPVVASVTFDAPLPAPATPEANPLRNRWNWKLPPSPTSEKVLSATPDEEGWTEEEDEAIRWMHKMHNAESTMSTQLRKLLPDIRRRLRKLGLTEASTKGNSRTRIAATNANLVWTAEEDEKLLELCTRTPKPPFSIFVHELGRSKSAIQARIHGKGFSKKRRRA